MVQILSKEMLMQVLKVLKSTIQAERQLLEFITLLQILARLLQEKVEMV